MRTAAHRRDNYKLMGFKRVLPPPKTLQDYMDEIQEKEANQDSPQSSTPQTTYIPTQGGDGGEDSFNEMAKIATPKDPQDTGVSTGDGIGDGPVRTADDQHL
jgi:hypothetical protein